MILENLNKIKNKLLELVSEEEQSLKKRITSAREPEDILKIMREYKKKLALRAETGGIDTGLAKTMVRLRAIYIGLYKEELQETMLHEHTQDRREQNEEAIKKMQEDLEEYGEDLQKWNEDFQSEMPEFLRKQELANTGVQSLQQEIDADQKQMQKLDQQLEQKRESLLKNTELQEQEVKLNDQLSNMLNQQEQTRVHEQAARIGEEINKEDLSEREQKLEQAQPKPAPIADQTQSAAPTPKSRLNLRGSLKKALEFKGLMQVQAMSTGNAQQYTNPLMQNFMEQIKADLRSGNLSGTGKKLEKQMEQFVEGLTNNPLFKKLGEKCDDFSEVLEEKKRLKESIASKVKKLEKQVNELLKMDMESPNQTSSEQVSAQKPKEHLNGSTKQAVVLKAEEKLGQSFESPTPLTIKLK